jgi:hypothetical protein
MRIGWLGDGAGFTPTLGWRWRLRPPGWPPVGAVAGGVGSPEEIFRAPLPRLERSNLPAAVAQAVYKKQSSNAPRRNWPPPNALIAAAW